MGCKSRLAEEPTPNRFNELIWIHGAVPLIDRRSAPKRERNGGRVYRRTAGWGEVGALKALTFN